MKKIKIIHLAAIIAVSASVLMPALAQATKKDRAFTVAIPGSTSARLAPTFALVLGMPKDGSCEHLAKVLDYDEDAVLLAKNKNGEEYCLIDNATTVREEKK